MSGTCGPKQENVFALYNQTTHIWKTYQGSFLQALTGEPTSDEYLESFPKSGTMLGGVCYRLPGLELLTKENGSGFLPTPRALESGDYQYSRGNHEKKVLTLTGYVKQFPTPRASIRGDCPSERARRTPDLHSFVKMYPTPAQRDWKGQNSVKSMENKLSNGQRAQQGQLPNAVAMMGDIGQLNPNWVEWLMGWPIGITDLKPLEMDRYQLWLQQHLEFYQKE